MFVHSSGTNRAFLLIALALGYIVCYLANREEKALRTVGYTIGISIIALSSLLILGNLFLEAKFWTKDARYISQHRMMMREQAPANMPIPMPLQK